MKKTLSLLAFAGMFAFTACGPSKEELEKKQKMHDDSVRIADSTTTAAAAKQKMYDDSVANANATKMQAMKDSLMKDSMDKANHKGPKKNTTPPPPKEIKHTTAPKGKG
jgi:hypothetical protein